MIALVVLSLAGTSMKDFIRPYVGSWKGVAETQRHDMLMLVDQRIEFTMNPDGSLKVVRRNSMPGTEDKQGPDPGLMGRSFRVTFRDAPKNGLYPAVKPDAGIEVLEFKDKKLFLRSRDERKGPVRIEIAIEDGKLSITDYEFYGLVPLSAGPPKPEVGWHRVCWSTLSKG